MKLLSTTQASEILGVNDSRIRQLIRDGQLQAVQVGRAYLLDEAVVRTFQRSPLGRPKKDPNEHAHPLPDCAEYDGVASRPTKKKPATMTTAQKKAIREAQQARWLESVPGQKAAKKGGKK